LFEDTSELISLYDAIDKIKNRFGENAIQRSVGVFNKKQAI
jgi:DNA polymerase-4